MLVLETLSLENAMCSSCMVIDPSCEDGPAASVSFRNRKRAKPSRCGTHLSGRLGGRNLVCIGMAEREDELARLAGLTGGMKDRAGIFFKDLQPVSEIARMTNLRRDVQMRAQKRAGQFGNQFL